MNRLTASNPIRPILALMVLARLKRQTCNPASAAERPARKMVQRNHRMSRRVETNKGDRGKGTNRAITKLQVPTTKSQRTLKPQIRTRVGEAARAGRVLKAKPEANRHKPSPARTAMLILAMTKPARLEMEAFAIAPIAVEG